MYFSQHDIRYKRKLKHFVVALDTVIVIFHSNTSILFPSFKRAVSSSASTELSCNTLLLSHFIPHMLMTPHPATKRQNVASIILITKMTWLVTSYVYTDCSFWFFRYLTIMKVILVCTTATSSVTIELITHLHILMYSSARRKKRTKKGMLTFQPSQEAV